MEKELLVLFSMTLSGIVVLIYNKLEQSKYNKKRDILFERFYTLEEMEKSGKIKRGIIYLDTPQQEQIKKKKTNLFKRNKVVLDGVEYTDKEFWFMMMDNVLYIVGKKKDVLVELHSKMFEEF